MILRAMPWIRDIFMNYEPLVNNVPDANMSE